MDKINNYLTKKINNRKKTSGIKKWFKGREINKMEKVKENIKSEYEKAKKDYQKLGNDSLPKLEPATIDEKDIGQVEGGEQLKGGINKIKEVTIPGGNNKSIKSFFKPEQKHLYRGIENNNGIRGKGTHVPTIKQLNSLLKERSPFYRYKNNRYELMAPHHGKKAGLPLIDPNQTGRTIATYRIAQLLETNMIPKTYGVKSNDSNMMEGPTRYDSSVMEKVGNSRKYRGKEDFQQYTNQFSNLYLLDMITGQVDRHFGNVLIQGEKLRGIDNDLAFGDQYNIDPKTGQSSVKIKG